MTPGWWDGLLLGLVQGLTEFLPISSSGHLVLAEDMLGFTPPGLYFEVGLHVATLLSVVVAYWSRLRALVRGMLEREGESWRYIGMLLLGSIPAAIAGIGFRDFFERSFESGIAIGVQFLVTALVLWLTRPALARATGTRIGPLTALGVGVAQAVAILPAISRSGTTIATALWAGVAPKPAAEFSFLLSLIAIGGSGLLEIRHIPPGADLLSVGFALAFFAALVSGIWAIRFLVRVLEKGRFHVFAWYCAALGLLTILWYGARAG